MKRGELIADRFEVHEVAGAGAMGVVWRAEDRATRRAVAVKILRVGSEPERFAREARLLAELDHPGIVRYVAHGESDEGPYLVMEWLAGESLAARLERRELSIGESVAVVARIASAIGAAHRRFVVHRDLKPSNVFLVRSALDDIRVLDFGVARHGALSSDLTRTGMVIGSPRYMAPEQARGEREVGPAADVWALGAILFRCLTGRALYVSGPMELIVSDLLLSPVPRVSDVLPDVPSELDDLVARLLTKDPAERPADGVAVAEALAQLSLPHSSLVPPGHRSEAPTFTLQEQRFSCVVLVRGPSGPLTELRPAIEALVRRRGGTIRHENGAIHIVLAASGTASDLVTNAARCALDVRELAPRARVSIATGSGGSTQSSRPERSVAERAEAALNYRDADYNGIVVDPSAVGLLEPRFELSRQDDRTVLLISEREDPSPVRRLLGRSTPCVGRERELSTLHALVTESFSEGVARVALMTGPAGIGKSRVRYEVLQRVERVAHEHPSTAPALWLGRADLVAAGSPFGVLGSALRAGLDVSGNEGARQRLRDRVSRHVPARDVDRICENLSMLTGISLTEDPRDPTLADPVRVGDQLRAGFEDFLEAELDAHPVLLVLEDLQWGDWPSLRFADAALRLFRDRPLFVLGIGRPEVTDLFPGLWSERSVVHLPLTELGKRASERLVRAVLGDRMDDDAVERVAERAGGNAFFLEELIRAIADSSEAALPESVLAMTQARIFDLEPEARQLLRAASVFGPVFWHRGAAALLSGARTEGELREWTDRLVERELLTRRRSSHFAGEEELVFRHGLVRDAAYSMLTEDDRMLGHRLAAAWLEGVGERDALLLAEHWSLGGQSARSAPLYCRAAEQAIEGNDFEAALAHAERALAAGVEGDRRAEALLLQAKAHHWRGDAARCETAARSAMAELPRLSRRWYAAAAEAARVASRLGRHDDLASLFAELESDTTADTAVQRAVVLAQIGVAALRAGQTELSSRIRSALQSTRPALSIADHEARAWIARFDGYAALVAGDVAAYLRRTEDAVECFLLASNERLRLTFQTSVGFANIALGRYAQAEVVLREALGSAERMNLAITCAVANHNLGYAVALQGRLAEGIEIERQAVAEAARQGDRWIEAVSETYLAILLLAADDPLGSAAAARRSFGISDSPHRALAGAVLARALLASGDLSGALSAAGESQDLLDQLGGIEDGDALVRLAWAEALAANGDESRARTAITQARERLLARAAQISEPELRESFLENVPEHARTLSLADAWLDE